MPYSDLPTFDLPTPDFQRSVLKKLDRIIALLERGAAPLPACPPPTPYFPSQRRTHPYEYIPPREPSPFGPDVVWTT